jgi:hypothetical protein
MFISLFIVHHKNGACSISCELITRGSKFRAFDTFWILISISDTQLHAFVTERSTAENEIHHRSSGLRRCRYVAVSTNKACMNSTIACHFDTDLAHCHSHIDRRDTADSHLHYYIHTRSSIRTYIHTYKDIQIHTYIHTYIYH